MASEETGIHKDTAADEDEADDDADDEAGEDEASDDGTRDEASDRTEDASDARTDTAANASHGQDDQPYGYRYGWPYKYKYQYGYGYEPGTSVSQASDYGAEGSAEPMTTDSPTTAGYRGYSPAYPDEHYAYREPSEDAATEEPMEADSSDRGTETTEDVTQPDAAQGNEGAVSRPDATEADHGGESAVIEKLVTEEVGEAAPCQRPADACPDVDAKPSDTAPEPADEVAVSAAGRSLLSTWVTLVVEPLKAAVTVARDFQPRLSLPGWARVLNNSAEGGLSAQGVPDEF
jgi:hypothetical protein